MNIRQLSTYAAVALASGTVGAWLTSTPEPVRAAVLAGASQSHATASARPLGESAPLIAVSSYGTVTLRVEQQPLEWVLDEIAKQSGLLDVNDRTGIGQRPVSAAVGDGQAAASCTTAKGSVQPQSMALLQAIAQGTDDERYDSLLRARSDGLSLPDDALKRLYENDASDRVRSLAFQRFLEGRASNVDEMRKALEAGLAVSNLAVQNEARRRLDSLLDGQGIDTSLQ